MQILSKLLIQIQNPPFFHCLHRGRNIDLVTQTDKNLNLILDKYPSPTTKETPAKRKMYFNIKKDCRPFSLRKFQPRAPTSAFKMPTEDKKDTGASIFHKNSNASRNAEGLIAIENRSILTKPRAVTEIQLHSSELTLKRRRSSCQNLTECLITS